MSGSITCQRFFDGIDLVGPHRITLNNGVVASVEPFEGPADYYLLTPGLVDIQMNGFHSVDVARASSDELHALGLQLQALGTTSWLATITSAPLEVLSDAIHRITSALEDGSAIGCVGIHVEGPFLGDAPGAHRKEWIIPFDPKWASQLPSSIRLMTIAAEQPNLERAIHVLRESDITVSIGHSRPTEQQWKVAKDSGATMVTHLFNGMSGIHHRESGLALHALVDDEIFVGVIGDMIHVSPDAVNLAYRAKGSALTCLVSDSIGWLTPQVSKRNLEASSGAPRMPDGTLAGSSTPLSECVRRVVLEARVPLEDALRSATSTPAMAVGLADVGYVGVGQPADLLAFDESLHVVRTWSRLVSLRG